MAKVKAGQLYSVIDGDGYSIVKILAASAGYVHVKWYKNKFGFRPDPEHIDPTKLTTGTIKDADGNGIEHVPMLSEDFQVRQPDLVGQTRVSFDELESYRQWQDEGGPGTMPFSPSEFRDMVGDIFGDIPDE